MWQVGRLITGQLAPVYCWPGLKPYAPEIVRGSIDAGRFVEDGSTEFLALDVLDACGEVIDRVAWQPHRPERFWTERGVAVWLGEDEAAEHHLRGMCAFGDDGERENLYGTLHLYSTPAAYFMSREPGMCLLDPTAPDFEILYLFDVVRCETRALAALLHDAIRRVVQPSFRLTFQRSESDPTGERHAGQRHARPARRQGPRRGAVNKPGGGDIDSWL